MRVPPPVSGEAYSTEIGSTARSNYLRSGFTFTGGYGNDLVGVVGVNSGSDFSYSFFPTIDIDRLGPRMHVVTTYSPSLIIYQGENHLNQNLLFNFQYRVSPHVTLSLRDSLQKTEYAFNQLDQFTQPTGGVTTSNSSVDALADQLSNQASVDLTYQYSRNSMVGAEGIFTKLDYLNQPETDNGLYNSTTAGGSMFYSRRLSRNHYTGATYQYTKTLSYPPGSTSQLLTQSILYFYTVYLKRTFSLSASVGPQHYEISESSLPAYASWSPSVTVSGGWQRNQTNLAVSYSRAITGGGGLVGVFQSSTISGSALWRLGRKWTAGAAANYLTNDDVTPAVYLSTQGGHRVVGTASLQRQLNQSFSIEFRYSDVHQKYVGIPVVNNAPDASLESVSISYNFSKALGGR